MDRARDDLARRAEAQYPGWTIRHGIYGWTGTRTGDGLTRRATSLPALRPLLAIAGTRPGAVPENPPARARPWACARAGHQYPARARTRRNAG
jgi:hypothetical protein